MCPLSAESRRNVDYELTGISYKYAHICWGLFGGLLQHACTHTWLWLRRGCQRWVRKGLGISVFASEHVTLSPAACWHRGSCGTPLKGVAGRLAEGGGGVRRPQPARSRKFPLSSWQGESSLSGPDNWHEGRKQLTGRHRQALYLRCTGRLKLWNLCWLSLSCRPVQHPFKSINRIIKKRFSGLPFYLFYSLRSWCTNASLPFKSAHFFSSFSNTSSTVYISNVFFPPFWVAIALPSFPCGLKINKQALETCLSCVMHDSLHSFGFDIIIELCCSFIYITVRVTQLMWVSRVCKWAFILQ